VLGQNAVGSRCRRLTDTTGKPSLGSDEARNDVHARLAAGLDALSRLSRFSPHVCGEAFTAADCGAHFHLDYDRQATSKIYGADMLEKHLPRGAEDLAHVAQRPHVRTTIADRARALSVFHSLGVDHAG
jgi:glutathione S-transferase